MPKSNRLRYTAALLAGSIPALAGLLSVAAQANDRDLRATTVPAAACVESFREGPDEGEAGFVVGYFFVAADRGVLRVRCPLPVHDIEVSSSSDDNDISRIRVQYQDPDGEDGDAFVTGALFLSRASISRQDIILTPICEFNSNVQDSTEATRTIFDCRHDLVHRAFYWFSIELVNFSDSGEVRFVGIDFPAVGEAP